MTIAVTTLVLTLVLSLLLLLQYTTIVTTLAIIDIVSFDISATIIIGMTVIMKSLLLFIRLLLLFYILFLLLSLLRHYYCTLAALATPSTRTERSVTHTYGSHSKKTYQAWAGLVLKGGLCQVLSLPSLHCPHGLQVRFCRDIVDPPDQGARQPWHFSSSSIGLHQAAGAASAPLRPSPKSREAH